MYTVRIPSRNLLLIYIYLPFYRLYDLRRVFLSLRKVNAADSALHLPTFLRIRDESFERVVPVRHNDARQPPQSTALRQEFERNIDDERERE